MEQLPLFDEPLDSDDEPYDEDISDWGPEADIVDDFTSRRREDDEATQRYDKLIEEFEAAEIQRELHDDFWSDQYDDGECDYSTPSSDAREQRQ